MCLLVLDRVGLGWIVFSWVRIGGKKLGGGVYLFFLFLPMTLDDDLSILAGHESIAYHTVQPIARSTGITYQFELGCNYSVGPIPSLDRFISSFYRPAFTSFMLQAIFRSISSCQVT